MHLSHLISSHSYAEMSKFGLLFVASSTPLLRSADIAVSHSDHKAYLTLSLFLSLNLLSSFIYPISHYFSLSLSLSHADELEVLNSTLLLSRGDLQVLHNESHAAEERLQRINCEVDDLLILLEEKKEELREVEARNADTQDAIVMSGRTGGFGDDSAVRSDASPDGRGEETRRESTNPMEGVRGETARGMSERRKEEDKQRCADTAHELRALQQAVSVEENRLQSLRCLGEDRARSLKRTCVQFKSSRPLLLFDSPLIRLRLLVLISLAMAIKRYDCSCFIHTILHTCALSSGSG